MKRLLIGLTFLAMAAWPLTVGHYSASAQQGGVIEGTVKLTATPPRNPVILMGADPNCLQINAGKRVVQQNVLKSADGGLANAIAYLKGSFPQSAVSSTPVVIDQQGCVYHPRIQGARVGQTLQVKNSDRTLHSINSLTTKDNSFNVSQPLAGMTFQFKLKSEEILHVKCNVHPWMSGHIVILNHPYYGVSDTAGSFRISGVPAGRHTIHVWHEIYGELMQNVDVSASGPSRVEFTYTGTSR